MKLREILSFDRESLINIEDSKEYAMAGVQSYGKGIVIRRNVFGRELHMKKYKVIKENQLMWCKVDTKNGAFGITKPEHEGSLASTNMSLANINLKKASPEFIQLFFTIKSFYEHINGLSTGTTNRKYLTPEQVLDLIEIPTLTREEQDIFMKKFNLFKEKQNSLKNLNVLNESLILSLRSSILQQAVQGKLVKQNLKDEPASELLKKIKAEKEKLIKEGKIRKDKPLAPISEDEIPYELPKGWEWVRLGEVITLNGGKRVPNGYQLLTEPTNHVYIRVTDMKNGTIDDSNLRYISQEVFEGIKNYIIRKEDLYITIAGTIGQIGEVPEKFDNMNLTENAARISLYKIDRTFLRYCLSSNVIQEQFTDKTKQMAQPKLALERIKSTLFPLPPLAEQKRIVEKVDKLMTYCDELEKQVKENQENAEKLMSAVLKEGFEN